MDASTITIICNAAVTCVLAITGVATLWITYKTKAIAQNAVDLGQHNAVVGAANAEKIDAVKGQTDDLTKALVTSDKKA